MSGVRFVGGMNVPGAVGRVNASMPLAELTVRDGELALRPRWFGGWLFTRFAVPVSTIEQAFPLRGRVLAPGVGFTLSGGEVAYFWTFSADGVLQALAAAGVPVDPQPRRATRLWTLRRSRIGPPGAAQLARPLVRLLPLLNLLSIPVMVGLVVSTSNAWFRAIVVSVWLLSVVVNGRLWWHSRQPSK